MSYLNPPPAPAPVIVVKDVGGLVRDYQTQTEFYRRTDREVRVHECHSACTLALSLPNVCVYPDSIFKFHQAYNEINRQTDLGVSDQLYEAYPAAVRARLGPLTRQFKIMRGTELIALGIRDCNTPRTIVASAERSPLSSKSASQNPTLGAVWSDMMSAFGAKATEPTPARPKTTLVATRPSTEAERNRTASLTAAVPPRPATSGTPQQLAETKTPETNAADVASTPADVPLPPTRPNTLSATLTASLTQTMPERVLPPVMAGAQPILPPHFLAYAMIARLSR